MSSGLVEVKIAQQEFDIAAIDAVYQAAANTPSTEYRNVMLEALADSKALFGMHCGLLEWRSQTVPSEESEFATRAQTMGLLVTLDILLQTAPFDVTKIDPSRVRDYQDLIIEDPGIVDEEFYYAYVGHEPVINFVDLTLRNEYSRFGARVLFGYFGDEANPSKPATILPSTNGNVVDGVAAFLSIKSAKVSGPPRRF